MDALEGLLRVLDPHLEVVQVAAVPVAYSAVEPAQSDDVVLHYEHLLDQLIHMVTVRTPVVEGLQDVEARGRLQEASSVCRPCPSKELRSRRAR